MSDPKNEYFIVNFPHRAMKAMATVRMRIRDLAPSLEATLAAATLRSSKLLPVPTREPDPPMLPSFADILTGKAVIAEDGIAEPTDPDLEILSWSVSGLPLALAFTDRERGRRVKAAPPAAGALPDAEAA